MYMEDELYVVAANKETLDSSLTSSLILREEIPRVIKVYLEVKVGICKVILMT